MCVSEKFEDTTGIIRTVNHRTDNAMAHRKRTMSYKSLLVYRNMEIGHHEGSAVPAPLVAPVVLQLNDTNIVWINWSIRKK